jgi:predicted RecA/RadA family phage recombinase
MVNYVQDGDTILLTAPYTVTSGQAAKVGKFFGVACDDITSGSTGQFKTDGVFAITKTTGAIAQGDPVFWDNTNKYLTTTANSNTEVGVCLVAALSGDTTATVRLNVGLKPQKFVSSEQTGTGSAQNVAHGMGVTPTRVIITYTDLTPATVGSVNVTYGSHTSTNVVVTVTSGKKFIVFAEY